MPMGGRHASGRARPVSRRQFHQYHQDTFQEAKLDPSVFDVPKICEATWKTGGNTCFVQPTFFCGR